MSTAASSDAEIRATARRPWRVAWWYAGALLPTLVFAAAVALPLAPGPHWLSPVVHGLAPSLAFAAWLPMMVVYVALGAAFAVGRLLNPERQRAGRLQLSVMLLCGFGLCVGLVRPLGHARMWLAAKVPARAQPLVEALARFDQDHGHYPASLTALVPEYLPRVPGTGLLGAPDFGYTRAGPEDDDGRGAWPAEQGAGYDLSISCPWGFVNFDSMHYWPSGSYPRRAWGGETEKVDGWVYVHE